MRKARSLYLPVVTLVYLVVAACGSADSDDHGSCATIRCNPGFICDLTTQRCVATDGLRPDASFASDAPPDALHSSDASTTADAPFEPDATVDAPVEPDAPPLDVFDAEVADAEQPDAPTPDATLAIDARPDASIPDAAVPDAAPPPITVTVVDPSGNPESGVDVVFHDSQGLPIVVRKTNGSGTVTAAMAAGGAVTALQTINAEETLRTTIFAVQPGDTLTIRQLPFAGPGPGTAQLTVELPSPVDGADTYSIYAGCEYAEKGDVNPFVLSVRTDCAIAGTFDVLARARTPFPYHVLQYAWAKGVAAPGTIALSSWDSQAIQISFDGSPAWQPDQVSVTPLLRFVRHLGDAGRMTDWSPVTLTAPRNFADGYEISVDRFGITSSSNYTARRTGAIPATARAPSSAMMPTIATNDISTAESGIARPRVTWTFDGPVPTFDGGIILYGWSDGALKRPEAPPTPHLWLLVYPPSMSGSVTTPALPDGLGGWRPNPSTLYLGRIFATASTLISGYDEFRRTYYELNDGAQVRSWTTTSVYGRQ